MALLCSLSEKAKQATEDDDVYHFVGYVPVDGVLYELDGLQEGPIKLGPCARDATWLDAVKPVIQARMQRYAGGETSFNLLALIKNKKVVLAEQLARVQGQAGKEREVSDLKEEMLQEDELFTRWKEENERRRHNYIPLAFQLISILCKHNKLREAVRSFSSCARLSFLVFFLFCSIVLLLSFRFVVYSPC